MEEVGDANTKYAQCARFKRQKPSQHIDKATLDSFQLDFRVLPLFEKKCFDYTRVRHYSLRTNQLLGCRWIHYNAAYHSTKRHPFKFPKVQDFHFYMYHTRYEPSQSIDQRTDFRRSMGFGPNVMTVMQVPVPEDMQVRKTVSDKRKKTTKNRK